MVNHPPAGRFQIKFCGKCSALRVAAKRYASPYKTTQLQKKNTSE